MPAYNRKVRLSLRRQDGPDTGPAPPECVSVWRMMQHTTFKHDAESVMTGIKADPRIPGHFVVSSLHAGEPRQGKKWRDMPSA